MPLISVITVNLNNLNGLRKTKKSIEAFRKKVQKENKSIEYVVVDGKSNDGSVKYLEEATCVEKWISEKDNGIADGFNKGVIESSGDWLLFLNSGDYFHESIDVKKLIYDLEKSDDFVGMVVGKIEINKRVFGRPGNKRRMLFRNYIPHQATFIRRKAFEDIGLYDEKMKLGMDYDWAIRMFFKSSYQAKFVNILIANMEPGGVSVSNPEKSFIAYHQARNKNNVIPPFASYILLVAGLLKIQVGKLYRKIVQCS